MATQTVTQDVTFNRNSYIGGSDIAAIMGISRWKTPLKLWAEKTGKIDTPDLSNVEAVEMGTKLEQFVADLFTDRTGKNVRKAPKVYQHPEYPYMVAHIDRLVTGTDELLECKTCSLFKKDEWDGEEIPQEYILQVMWYLGITGRKVGHIAVLIGGQSFKYKKIEFDKELFDLMVASAKTFWQHVQTDTPVAVMANDDDTLKELYNEHNEVFIELFPMDDKSTEATTVFEEKVAHLQELKRELKEIDTEKKQIESEIKKLIKNNIGIKTPKYIITWKFQNGQVIYDKEQMQADGVYEKYASQAVNRVMRIAANKGGQ